MIVEVYRGGGVWQSNIIADRTLTLGTGIGTLQQMDNELEASLSVDKRAVILKWIDAPTVNSTYGDIFLCGKIGRAHV